MEIGKKIRELRIARNLTQEALAAELSVTPQAISSGSAGVHLDKDTTPIPR
ncbi:MAG: helix-turn-helix transcriptional regulator [Oscillospiraceae bacterium]